LFKEKKNTFIKGWFGSATKKRGLFNSGSKQVGFPSRCFSKKIINSKVGKEKNGFKRKKKSGK